MNLNSTPFLRLALVVILALFGICCIGLATWQAMPAHPFPDRSERIRRAVLVGFAFQGFFLSVLLIGAFLKTDYPWSFEILWVLCFTIPLQIWITILYYLRMGMLSSVIRIVTSAIRRKSE